MPDTIQVVEARASVDGWAPVREGTDEERRFEAIYRERFASVDAYVRRRDDIVANE